MKPNLVVALLPLLWLVALLACSDGEKDFGESVRDVRNDPDFRDREDTLRETYERCVDSSSDARCLGIFSDSVEKSFFACFVVYPGELCSLEIDVIAEEHGWDLNDDKRDSGLLRDDDFTSYETDCLQERVEGACFAFWTADIESSFDICVDIWGGGSCKDVLSDLKSHALSEPTYDVP